MSLDELSESAVATLERTDIDDNDLDLGIQNIQLDSDLASNITDGVTASACCGKHTTVSLSTFTTITDGVTSTGCCKPTRFN